MRIHTPNSIQNQLPSESEYKILINSIKNRDFEKFKSILTQNKDLVTEKPHILEYFLNTENKEDFKFVRLILNITRCFSYSLFLNYFVKSHLNEDEMLELIDILVDLGKTDVLLGTDGITHKLFQSLNFTQLDYCTIHPLSQTYSKVFNRLFQLGGCSHVPHPFRDFFEKQHRPISSSNLKAFTDQLDLKVKDPEGRSWLTSIMDRCQPNDFELLLIVRNLVSGGAEIPILGREHPWFPFLEGLAGSDLQFVKISLAIIDPNQTVLDLRDEPWGHSISKCQEMPRQYPKLQTMVKKLPLTEFLQLLICKEGENLFKIIPPHFLVKKTKEIFPKTTGAERKAIFEKASRFAPQSFLIELVKIALKNKVDPLSKLTESDPRSLLRILIDDSNTTDFTSDLQSLWLYMTLPREHLREHFPKGSFLAYKLEQSLRFSQESLFKFALQSTSLAHENFIPNLDIPEKTISSRGSFPEAIYPYITLYLEEFLFNLEEHDLDDATIQEILQVFLFNSAESNVKKSHLQHSLFQTHGFTFIPTGFLRHSFPVVFFKANKTVLRAIPNRGGGAFNRSLSIHSLENSAVTAQELKKMAKMAQKAEEESLNYLYLKSLLTQQATGTGMIHRLFQEKFSKKPQTLGNCTTVGGKAAVELILSASKLQRISGEDLPNENFIKRLEQSLSHTNKQYKWFSLFASLGALNDLYKNANQNKIFFDPKAEKMMLAKIEKKFEKLTDRLGKAPEIVFKKLKSVREKSKDYRIKISELTRPVTKEKIPTQAIKDGNVEEVKDWITGGGDLFACDTRRNSALHLAISNGQTKVALLLIENGIALISLNLDDEYPLFLAVVKRNKTITDKLLELTKPESYTGYRQNPLEIAFWTKDVELVGQFIRAGFNSAAMLQINSIFRDRELFENCLQKGLEINSKNLEDKTLFDTFFEDCLKEMNPQDVNQGVFFGIHTEMFERLRYLKTKGLQWTASMAEKVLENYRGLLNEFSLTAFFLRENCQT